MRWKLLLNPLGHKPKLSNTFSALMIGYLANYALPRLGEITRCGILSKYEKIPVTESLGTVIAERAVDMLCLVILFAFTILSQFDLIYNYSLKIVLIPLNDKLNNLFNSKTTIIIIALLFLATSYIIYKYRRKISKNNLIQKIGNLLLGFIEGIKSIKNIKQPGLFIFHSVFIWAMYFLTIYFGFLGLEQTKVLGSDAGFAVLIFGSLGMIAVQGGIGAYPVLVMQTLTLYGISANVGFAFGWIAWCAQTALVLILGFGALILIPLINKR